MAKIESGIPLPATRRGRYPKKERKYPWAQLNPGDSFLADISNMKVKFPITNIHSVFNHWRKTHGVTWKIAIRRVDEKTVRVWRLPAKVVILPPTEPSPYFQIDRDIPLYRTYIPSK